MWGALVAFSRLRSVVGKNFPENVRSSNMDAANEKYKCLYYSKKMLNIVTIRIYFIHV